jgi:hypothetical protein
MNARTTKTGVMDIRPTIIMPAEKICPNPDNSLRWFICAALPKAGPKLERHESAKEKAPSTSKPPLVSINAPGIRTKSDKKISPTILEKAVCPIEE